MQENFSAALSAPSNSSSTSEERGSGTGRFGGGEIPAVVAKRRQLFSMLSESLFDLEPLMKRLEQSASKRQTVLWSLNVARGAASFLLMLLGLHRLSLHGVAVSLMHRLNELSIKASDLEQLVQKLESESRELEEHLNAKNSQIQELEDTAQDVVPPLPPLEILQSVSIHGRHLYVASADGRGDRALLSGGDRHGRRRRRGRLHSVGGSSPATDSRLSRQSRDKSEPGFTTAMRHEQVITGTIILIFDHSNNSTRP